MDLPVWQALYEELADEGFMVVSVSFDTRAPDASRPWIDAANPTYVCVLDPQHEVAELYNMVNVPQAVWIDEDGRIVRHTETAGVGDEFRTMMDPGGIPPDDLGTMMRRRERYIDAIRRWVRTGEVEEQHDVPVHSDDDALAFAHFRFGAWLAREGRDDESALQLAEARRLRPESWAFRRQSWELEELGKAGGPDFWAAVNDLADLHYYAPVNMAGLED